MDLRICFVGDSFVNGTGDPTCLGWAGRVCTAARAEGHEITYYNLGIRRETSADIKRRWQQEVIPRLPDRNEGRIVFSFGVNDTTIEDNLRRVKRHDSIQNACDILGAAQQVYPTIMIGPPPIADNEQNVRIADLSAEFARVCKDLNIPYLAIFDALITSQGWMNEVAAQDGAHPYATGYEELAHLVSHWTGWQNFLK
ncbi:MAG TPA: GDSL-type esterase/lipase family protein [Crinalium sp.]|jgi:lysophospholipase L1-like esterase